MDLIDPIHHLDRVIVHSSHLGFVVGAAAFDAQQLTWKQHSDKLLR